ncbi:MAG: rod shape-determining protein MreC [Raineya sp.]|jgi:rod shape-determining protein MreC|nr:rod shape-determining protein MreC [Raineya sp.]
MQAIFNFLYRFRATFLFCILQIICLLLIARFNNYQRAFIFNTSSFYVGKLNQWSNEATDYLHLKDVNQKLAEENARLNEQLAKERQYKYTNVEPINNTSIASKYRFETAKVVNKTTRKLRNFITIEKGAENGIEKDMGVISASGIVGRVIEVSPHYAVVSTILHNQSTTPVHVKLKSLGDNYLSHIQWDGKDPNYTKLKDIPLSIPVSIGDTIKTTGYNAFFPADVMVGVVARINPQKTSTFHDIDVRLSTNFNTLGYVYVVKNKLQQEQLEIEKDTTKVKITTRK